MCIGALDDRSLWLYSPAPLRSPPSKPHETTSQDPEGESDVLAVRACVLPHGSRVTAARVAAGEVIAAPVKDEELRRAAEKIHCTPLTSREHEILRRAARGETNAEIAKAIFLSPTTVKSYIQSALRKLEVRNRVEAVYK